VIEESANRRVVQRYRALFPPAYGGVSVGVAQEKAKALDRHAGTRRAACPISYRRKSVCLNHADFYVLDPE